MSVSEESVVVFDKAQNSATQIKRGKGLEKLCKV